MQQSIQQKIIAMVLSLILGCSNVTYADPIAVSSSAEQRNIPKTVPEKLGSIVEQYSGGKDGTVILIEDAHTSLEAQYAIAGLVDHVTRYNDVPLVCFEGYTGSLGEWLDAAFSSDSVSEAVNRSVADLLMQHGELSGSHYGYLFRQGDYSLVGVEDTKSYHKNLAAFQTLLTQNKECIAFIESRKKSVAILKKRYYPASIMHLDMCKSSWRDGGDLSAFIEALIAAKDTYGLSLDTYPLLMRLMRSEDAIDATSVDAIRFLSECDRLSNQITKLALTGKSREVCAMDEHVQMLSKVVTASLSREEWNLLYQRKEAFLTECACDSAYLTAEGQLGCADADTVVDKIDCLLTQVKDFYDEATDRDKQLARNTWRAMKRRHTDTAILVAGGFHTKGITFYLKEHDLSYVVVNPRITSLETSFQEQYYDKAAGSTTHILSDLMPLFANKIAIANLFTDDRGNAPDPALVVHVLQLLCNDEIPEACGVLRTLQKEYKDSFRYRVITEPTDNGRAVKKLRVWNVCTDAAVDINFSDLHTRKSTVLQKNGADAVFNVLCYSDSLHLSGRCMGLKKGQTLSVLQNAPMFGGLHKPGEVEDLIAMAEKLDQEGFIPEFSADEKSTCAALQAYREKYQNRVIAAGISVDGEFVAFEAARYADVLVASEVLGSDFILRLRQVNPSIVIIAGAKNEAEARETLDNGADGVKLKPFAKDGKLLENLALVNRLQQEYPHALLGGAGGISDKNLGSILLHHNVVFVGCGFDNRQELEKTLPGLVRVKKAFQNECLLSQVKNPGENKELRRFVHSLPEWDALGKVYVDDKGRPTKCAHMDDYMNAFEALRGDNFDLFIERLPNQLSEEEEARYRLHLSKLHHAYTELDDEYQTALALASYIHDFGFMNGLPHGHELRGSVIVADILQREGFVDLFGSRICDLAVEMVKRHGDIGYVRFAGENRFSCLPDPEKEAQLFNALLIMNTCDTSAVLPEKSFLTLGQLEDNIRLLERDDAYLSLLQDEFHLFRLAKFAGFSSMDDSRMQTLAQTYERVVGESLYATDGTQLGALTEFLATDLDLMGGMTFVFQTLAKEEDDYLAFCRFLRFLMHVAVLTQEERDMDTLNIFSEFPGIWYSFLGRPNTNAWARAWLLAFTEWVDTHERELGHPMTVDDSRSYLASTQWQHFFGIPLVKHAEGVFIPVGRIVTHAEIDPADRTKLNIYYPDATAWAEKMGVDPSLLRDKRPHQTITFEHPITNITWSPNKELLIVTGNDGEQKAYVFDDEKKRFAPVRVPICPQRLPILIAADENTVWVTHEDQTVLFAYKQPFVVSLTEPGNRNQCDVYIYNNELLMMRPGVSHQIKSIKKADDTLVGDDVLPDSQADNASTVPAIAPKDVRILNDFLMQRDPLPDCADILMVLGNDYIEGVFEAVRLYQEGKAKTLMFVGGIGHSTQNLRDAAAAYLNCDKSKLAKLSEAQICESVFKEALRQNGVPENEINAIPIIFEMTSKNCQENLENAVAIIKKKKMNPKTIIVSQQPNLQRRIGLTWQKRCAHLLPDAEVYNYAAFEPTRTMLSDPAYVATMIDEAEKLEFYSDERFAFIAPLPDGGVLPHEVKDAIDRLKRSWPYRFIGDDGVVLAERVAIGDKLRMNLSESLQIESGTYRAGSSFTSFSTSAYYGVLYLKSGVARVHWEGQEVVLHAGETIALFTDFTVSFTEDSKYVFFRQVGKADQKETVQEKMIAKEVEQIGYEGIGQVTHYRSANRMNIDAIHFIPEDTVSFQAVTERLAGINIVDDVFATCSLEAFDKETIGGYWHKISVRHHSVSFSELLSDNDLQPLRNLYEKKKQTLQEAIARLDADAISVQTVLSSIDETLQYAFNCMPRDAFVDFLRGEGRAKNHGFEHVLNVCRNAVEIMQADRAVCTQIDLSLLIRAIVLHDISCIFSGHNKHATMSFFLALKILVLNAVPYDEAVKIAVIGCAHHDIECDALFGEGVSQKIYARYPEAAILKDADALEAALPMERVYHDVLYRPEVDLDTRMDMLWNNVVHDPLSDRLHYYCLFGLRRRMPTFYVSQGGRRLIASRLKSGVDEIMVAVRGSDDWDRTYDDQMAILVRTLALRFINQYVSNERDQLLPDEIEGINNTLRQLEHRHVTPPGIDANIHQGKTVLVTGGAGYIGGAVIRDLQRAGTNVIVYDDLSRGHESTIPEGCILEKGDLRDATRLNQVFEKHAIDAVVHLAAFIEVSESNRYPGRYFDNNVGSTLSLLDAMEHHKVKNLVFSSSAAVYDGMTKQHNPRNPYGETKLLMEKIMAEYEKKGMHFVALRYYNAAGAVEDGGVWHGEAHEPETHVIPNIIRAAVNGVVFYLQGTDYPTHDGTTVRDFVHIADLSRAHLLSLTWLYDGRKSEVFDLGTGKGSSMREVIDALEQEVSTSVTVEEVERRAGIPDTLIADYAKAAELLGWSPEHTIATIVKSAWLWHKNYAPVPEGRTHEDTPDDVFLTAVRDRVLASDLSLSLQAEILVRLFIDSVHAIHGDKKNSAVGALTTFGRQIVSDESTDVLSSLSLSTAWREFQQLLDAYFEGKTHQLTQVQQELVLVVRDLRYQYLLSNALSFLAEMDPERFDDEHFRRMISGNPYLLEGYRLFDFIADGGSMADGPLDTPARIAAMIAKYYPEGKEIEFVATCDETGTNLLGYGSVDHARIGNKEDNPLEQLAREKGRLPFAHPAVTAVIRMRDEDNNEMVLLSCRAVTQKSAAGKLEAVLGGKARPYETTVDTLIRELSEEIGVSRELVEKNMRLVGPKAYPNPWQYHTINVVYELSFDREATKKILDEMKKMKGVCTFAARDEEAFASYLPKNIQHEYGEDMSVDALTHAAKEVNSATEIAYCVLVPPRVLTRVYARLKEAYPETLSENLAWIYYDKEAQVWHYANFIEQMRMLDGELAVGLNGEDKEKRYDPAQVVSLEFDSAQFGVYMAVQEELQDRLWIDRTTEQCFYRDELGRKLSDRREIVQYLSTDEKMVAHFQENNSDLEVVASLDNCSLFANQGFVTYAEGKLFYPVGEDVWKKGYTSLIVMRDGTLAMDEVYYRTDRKNGRVIVMRNGQDITVQVMYATFGQFLLDGKGMVRDDFERIVPQFQDLRHVFRLPKILWHDVISSVDEDEVVSPKEVYFGVHALAEADYRLAKEAWNQPVMLDQSIFLAKKAGDDFGKRPYEVSENNVRAAFSDVGYEENSQGPLKRGEFRFVDGKIEVFFAFGVYPRTVVGITKERGIKLIGIPGFSGREGSTLQETAEIAREHNLQQAMILDHGGSAKVWHNGTYLLESSERRTWRTSALFVTKVRETSVQQSVDEIMGVGQEGAEKTIPRDATIMNIYLDGAGLEQYDEVLVKQVGEFLRGKEGVSDKDPVLHLVVPRTNAGAIGVAKQIQETLGEDKVAVDDIEAGSHAFQQFVQAKKNRHPERYMVMISDRPECFGNVPDTIDYPVYVHSDMLHNVNQVAYVPLSFMQELLTTPQINMPFWQVTDNGQPFFRVLSEVGAANAGAFVNEVLSRVIVQFREVRKERIMRAAA